ncbi:pyridoxamine 5'-phosphate oxidase [Streptomyces syringium]|uniref:pyridoxamine 5'-phosphate oxidase n=1 Tax=Streptomyces syringium TaxID=76729 RepID=UPI003AAC2F51
MQSPTPDAPAQDIPSPHDATDPITLFGQWLAAAEAAEINDANAMAIATADTDGLPDVRMVLLKGFDADGFVFYTNTQSQKGTELRDNMQAAGVLHWKSLRRQVRFRGPVEPTTAAEADAYFASRRRDSRLGAWASRQSHPLASRAELEEAVAREATRFPDDVPRPPHWSGYRIRPLSIEFWTDRPFRLHDRLVFRRDKPEGDWNTTRLYP